MSYELDTEGVAIIALSAFAVGFVAILVLDASRWRPAGIAVKAEPLPLDPGKASSIVDPG